MNTTLNPSNLLFQICLMSDLTMNHISDLFNHFDELTTHPDHDSSTSTLMYDDICTIYRSSDLFRVVTFRDSIDTPLHLIKTPFRDTSITPHTLTSDDHELLMRLDRLALFVSRND